MLPDTIAIINEIKGAVDRHIAMSEQSEKKIDQMYTVLIVGNGVPSIKERVNRLEANMLDKHTAAELETKMEHLEERLPDPKEWSKIKLWSDISIWVVGVIAAIVLGELIPKILDLLQAL